MRRPSFRYGNLRPVRRPSFYFFFIFYLFVKERVRNNRRLYLESGRKVAFFAHARLFRQRFCKVRLGRRADPTWPDRQARVRIRDRVLQAKDTPSRSTNQRGAFLGRGCILHAHWSFVPTSSCASLGGRGGEVRCGKVFG